MSEETKNNNGFSLTTSRTLEIAMDDKEKVEIGSQLVELNLRIEGLEKEKKQLPKDITALQEKVSSLSHQYERGMIEKELECLWILDEEKWEKTLKRTDNDEEIGKSTMSWYDFPDNEHTVLKMLKKAFEKKPEEDTEQMPWIEFPPEDGFEFLKDRFHEKRAKLIIEDLKDLFFMKDINIIIEQNDTKDALECIKLSFEKEVVLVDSVVKDNNGTSEATQTC